MTSYYGGSSIVKETWMGKGDHEWTFSAKSLFGGDGFKDAAEFQAYCGLMERMRAYADNYAAACDHPGILARVQDMVIDTMIKVARMEVGKNVRLISLVKESQGWPHEFVAGLAMGGDPAPASVPAPAMMN